MKNILEHAKWIWCKKEAGADEYGEFYADFVYQGGDLTVNISADSNYALYLNGKLAAFGQYADFPYDKIYDTVDIAPYAKIGKNHLAIVVWYYGITTTSVYYKGNAALLFDVLSGENVLAKSDENTLSRMSPAYENHKEKSITGQLGLSFSYLATKEDNWKMGELSGFERSTLVCQTLPLRKRPCEKLVLEEHRQGKEIKRITDTDVIYDLGTNEVGFLSLDIESETEQKLVIAYGEHLADGVVRQKIGSRDFSVVVTVKKGKTIYTNPFRRLGCRYLEVKAENPFVLSKIAIVPTMYPVIEQKRPPLTKEETEIYDICVRTLRLCMHEHYEDCPWREQALYCMDSRNQMLLGYYAFNEYRFSRANLELISKDDRPDGLLSICYPITQNLVIPSFSLHYFTECAEYLTYSGDKEFLREIYPKLQSIMKTFLSRLTEENIIFPFGEAKEFRFDSKMTYWNFYEWCPGLDGLKTDLSKPDLILNALLSIALENMAKISVAIGKEDCYTAVRNRLNNAIYQTFYSEKSGIFMDRRGEDRASKLGNSLAILCGAADHTMAKALCQKLTEKQTDLTLISLSMQCFLYDALLKVDAALYKDFILSDIEKNYRPMVEYGTGTVWETEKGEGDFGKAGSLCHGWSAIPIYYYHILKND